MLCDIFQRLNIGPGAEALFSMRGADADSADPYSGFNACHYVGDSAAHVAACRQLLAERFGVAVDRLVIPHQTHSINVATITDGPIPQLSDTDATVTRRSDVVLCINTADCLPIAFNDPSTGVIGLAHGGWRGIAGGIIPATVTAMQELGASPANIRAAIGPAIHVCCYEVDAAMGERFANQFADAADLLQPSPNPGKVNLNLIAAALSQLRHAGISAELTTVSELCTRCNSARIFSARALTPSSGRILTAIKRG